ncbi:MAG: alanine racemase [Peptococcaceae bacterium]|nr:MAG: alanine racemase [Peptococcaceae bacterium]
MSCSPVWAEIDLSAITHNAREIRRVAGTAIRIMAVVKADAYGHGAVEVSKAALAGGADWLGVARLAEGVALRAAGLDAPVLVLGYTPPEHSAEVIRYGLSQTVYTGEAASSLAAAAVREGKRARAHVKVDTGMGRVGWPAEPPAAREILSVASLPGLEIEGIFTHFATADSKDKTYAAEQLDRFLEVIEVLRKNGLEIPFKHAANSAALLEMPESRLDMVRPGIIIYGLFPSAEVDRTLINLRPAMSLKTRVAYVKSVPAGFKVSYGCTFISGRPTTIATLPLGYADGYSRLLSAKGEVLVHGRRAPVAGRVCMDYLMVDAGHIPGVAIGDEAVLFGRQGDEEIAVDEVAGWLGTINYEVVCMVSHRVPRIFLK